MKPHPALAQLARRPDIAACFRILGTDDCRLVGGAVRDALLSRPTGDIDFAARLAPEETLARLAAADIRAVETGIAHGGVTALFPQTRIEITRLRRDAETDGRHARIAPTTAWEEDARRRDFTINALYADAAGRLYDPLGSGESDLRAGMVRFIGAPAERIREDHLRILRFYRFSASHGGDAPEPDSRAACAAAHGDLSRISGERIRSELERILRHARAAEALDWMRRDGVLEECLAAPVSADALTHCSALMRLERRLRLLPDFLRRLACLALDAERLAERLRFSRAERKRFLTLRGMDGFVGGKTERGETPQKPGGFVGGKKMCFAARGEPLSIADLSALLYLHGRETAQDIFLLDWAQAEANDYPQKGAKKGREEAWERLLALPMPRFPLTGAMLRDAGIPEGEALGRLLAQVESEWLAAGLPDDPAWPLSRARQLMAEAK